MSDTLEVDATLDVTAELTRVTVALVDERKDHAITSELANSERARADSLEIEASSLRAEVDDVAKDRDEAEARADAVEAQLQLRDRLLATTATKLGEAYKANAAWRAPPPSTRRR